MVRITDALKNILVSLKSIHIRIEIYDNELSSAAANPPIAGYLPTYHLCCALGVTIPTLKINRHVAVATAEASSKAEQRVNFTLSDLQVYCDYGCESYIENLDSPVPAQVIHEFSSRWATEIHSGLLLPFDMEIVLDCDFRQRIGVIVPNISFTIQKFRFAVDPTQLVVLKDIAEAIASSSKRAASLTRLSNVFNPYIKPPPLLRGVGGLHLLPQLLLDGRLKYPSECSLLRPKMKSTVASCSALVRYFKALDSSMSWASRMWKHVISLLLEDLRLAKPLGRWRQLIKLVNMRKEYAYIYSRYLRKSKTSGKIIFFAGARLHHSLAMIVFNYEMLLPVPIIVAFRQLGMLVAIDELLKNKVRKLRVQDSSDPSTKISNSWVDLLKIHSMLIEIQQGNNHGFNSSVVDDSNDTDIVIVSEEISRSDSSVKSSDKVVKGGILSRLGRTVGLVSSAPDFMSSKDDLDSSILKTGEGAVLSDLIKYLDSDSLAEESIPYLPTVPDAFSQLPMQSSGPNSSITEQKHAPVPRDIWTSISLLDGEHPTLRNIAESVDWVVKAFRNPFHIFPPTVSINILEAELFFRSPKIDNVNTLRKNLISLGSRYIHCNVSISSLISDPNSSTKVVQALLAKRFPAFTFIPLDHALVQIRLSIASMQTSMHIHENISISSEYGNDVSAETKQDTQKTIQQVKTSVLSSGSKTVEIQSSGLSQAEKINGQVVRMIFSKMDTSFFVSTIVVDSTHGASLSSVDAQVTVISCKFFISTMY